MDHKIADQKEGRLSYRAEKPLDEADSGLNTLISNTLGVSFLDRIVLLSFRTHFASKLNPGIGGTD